MRVSAEAWSHMRRVRNLIAHAAFCATLVALAGACRVEDRVDGPNGDGASADDSGQDSDSEGDAVDTNSGDGGVDPGDGCDLGGIWAAKLVTWNLDAQVNSTQLSNNWFYLEITDSGQEIEITRSLDCGIEVRGLARVVLSETTTNALMAHNSQAGRRGEFYPDGDHCVFSFDRWFWIRGAAASYLPENFSDYTGADAIERLDSENPLPNRDDTEGAEDWDEDGLPGITYQIIGLPEGRAVVQRDWNEYFSSEERVIERPIGESFWAAAAFDNTEIILAVSNCDEENIDDCGLAATPSIPDPAGRHIIKFQRLNGDDLDGLSDSEVCSSIRTLIPAQGP